MFLNLLLMVSPGVACAQTQLAHIFSDHAVLQRDAPIHIWGWDTPGKAVTVTLRGQQGKPVSVATTTDTGGKWSADLPPQPAGGPYQLTVQGTGTATISDVLIGDVWIAGGQSNMQLPLKGFPGSAPLKNGPQELANATQPQIRLIHIHPQTSSHPMADQDAVWGPCTPGTAANFSAVAYFFGREIQQRQNVPIGLIEEVYGGTPIEPWISLDSLNADPAAKPVFALWDKIAPHAQDSWAPAYIYNAMIQPLLGLRVKGFLWYQGETSASPDRAPLYFNLFSLLVNDWRSKWGLGNFPFLYAQISSFKGKPGDDWGIIRDAQRRVLSLPNTRMAVTLDVGDPNNIHPPDKQTVAHRLVLTARNLVYGENIEDSGPLYRSTALDGHNIRVTFDHAEGLVAKGGTELTGFEVAGDDHRFFPATATIEGSTVIVTGSSVAAPKFVRYAWANVPVANLYNGADLPAGTFSSESAADAAKIR
jgi:sialate O-acetylesterase